LSEQLNRQTTHAATEARAAATANPRPAEPEFAALLVRQRDAERSCLQISMPDACRC